MAEKIFILDNDYKRIIQDAIRDVFTDAALRREEEIAAIEQMVSYLNVRYDVSNLFPATKRWNSRLTYNPGDYVEFNGTFYRALTPATATAANKDQRPDAASTEYWSSDTFPNIKTWDGGETVAVGQYREQSNLFYRCEVGHSNEDPSDSANDYDPVAETGFWTEDDPRDAKLVEICCELTLYKLHARISPDQIPELRVQHHDMAIEYLKEIASGKNAPMLPTIASTEDNKSTVQYGSIAKRTYNY